MKKIVIGILAHVDSGKTTLSEALLYKSGSIKKIGRVDHKDAFLDTFEIEKNRGITVFSKQAILNLERTKVTLLDTPGHVDFSSEMERTLQVLDYAILVINALDGIQSHTKTLWELLKLYNIPTLVFVNKMDIPTIDYQKIYNEIKDELSENCVEFSNDNKNLYEEIATCSEDLLENYLIEGKVDNNLIIDKIINRSIFPCFFGSALKMQGVSQFLNFIDKNTKQKVNDNIFSATIFKISRDNQGNRLSHLKVNSGVLKVKDNIEFITEAGEPFKEKINQIRMYSGAKFDLAQVAQAGEVCIVTGPLNTYAGLEIGKKTEKRMPSLQPFISYGVNFEDGLDAFSVLGKFKILQEEDPLLKVEYNEQLKKISIQLMGKIQQEIVKQVFKDRFNIEIGFDVGQILYKETIKNKVEGVGHFEPLRHYSEVHLIIEPAKLGEGIVIINQCNEALEKNWQRLIMAHLAEKTHLGVLTGSALTDVKIRLVNGKGHVEYTDGGDFRQATYRAVRQGLMNAQSVLLEPWYNYEISLPYENLGRAMADIQKMSGTFLPPELNNDIAILKGSVPAVNFIDYQIDLNSYTKGLGRLSFNLDGYRPCHNQEKVIEKIGYNPTSDLANTPDSVFCKNGAGFTVKWDEVYDFMHLSKALNDKIELTDNIKIKKQAEKYITDSFANDKTLIEIFEKTYGPIKRTALAALSTQRQNYSVVENKKVIENYEEYILVDGYNVIFAWAELGELLKDNLDYSRNRLADMLCNYAGFKNSKVILVFDAYKVKGNIGNYEKYNNIDIVYTKEAETADMYIEKVTHNLAKNYRVRVVTSDYLQQLIILGHGALRVSAKMFLEELKTIEKAIKELIQ